MPTTAHVSLDSAGMAWLDVRVSSSLGETSPWLGPTAPVYVTPRLADAVCARVEGIVSVVAAAAGRAVAADPSLCSRCVRTLARSALGTVTDAAKVVSPDNPRDPARYTAAWRALGGPMLHAQAAVEALRQEVSAGSVLDPVDAALTVTGASKWRDHYERAGAPLKAGQWTEYKLCACGDPTNVESTPEMLVR